MCHSSHYSHSVHHTKMQTITIILVALPTHSMSGSVTIFSDAVRGYLEVGVTLLTPALA